MTSPNTCNCPVSKYLKSNVGALENCVSCPNGCLECSIDGSICYSCKPGYFLDVSQTCTACHSNCAECYLAGNNNCFSCASSFYLDSDLKTCGTTCTTGVPDSTLSQCVSYLTIVTKLYYDGEIQNAVGVSTNPSFTTSYLPMYTYCGGQTIVGGWFKFESKSSVQTSLALPVHTYLNVTYSLYALGAWGGTDSLTVLVDGVVLNTWQPNIGASGSDICGNGINGLKQSFWHFYVHNKTNAVVFKIQSTANSNTQTFGFNALAFAVLNCFTTCDLCNGGNFDDCITCKAGTYTLMNSTKKSCWVTCP
jgi:hypothetical protein